MFALKPDTNSFTAFNLARFQWRSQGGKCLGSPGVKLKEFEERIIFTTSLGNLMSRVERKLSILREEGNKNTDILYCVNKWTLSVTTGSFSDFLANFMQLILARQQNFLTPRN